MFACCCRENLTSSTVYTLFVILSLYCDSWRGYHYLVHSTIARRNDIPGLNARRALSERIQTPHLNYARKSAREQYGTHAAQVLLRCGSMSRRGRQHQRPQRQLLPHQCQLVHGDQMVPVVLLRWHSPGHGLYRSSRQRGFIAPQGQGKQACGAPSFGTFHFR